MKISFDIEITPEEIFSIGELIEDKIAKEVVDELRNGPRASPVGNGIDIWTGKNVRIKANTPDSEIDSWRHKLQRDVIYGVSEYEFRDSSIKIQRSWYNNVWFEVVQN